MITRKVVMFLDTQKAIIQMPVYAIRFLLFYNVTIEAPYMVITINAIT